MEPLYQRILANAGDLYMDFGPWEKPLVFPRSEDSRSLHWGLSDGHARWAQGRCS
jgi:hypothetical protein